MAISKIKQQDLHIYQLCQASLDNCSTIEEVYQTLIANNGYGNANVGRNDSNNFITLVGDPDNGSSSAAAFVYISCALTGGATIIHLITVGNHGFKHKYIFRHPSASNNRQSTWTEL